MDVAALLRRAEWHHQAACHGLVDLMYDYNATDRAKAVCRTCPVRAQCLASALERKEPYGVWGGFDEKERAELVKATPDQIPNLLHKFAQRSL